MNKYFTVNDMVIHKINNKNIPLEHWSRKYEYAFALKYVKKNETVMYASFEHARPLEKYLKNNVKKVYDYTESVPDNSINTIFCIGYLQHEPKKEKMLKRLKIVLKNGGKIIITADYPKFKDEEFVKMVESVGLKFTGNKNYNNKDKDNIKGHYGGLRCYSAILKKNNEKNKTKKEITYKTKVIVPEETKLKKTKKEIKNRNGE